MYVYSLLLRLLRRLRRCVESPQKKKSQKADYWASRSHFKYFNTVQEWVCELSPGASIMDVGGRDTPAVTSGTFAERTVVDVYPQVKTYPGVRYVCADWIRDVYPEVQDLILCLQVLEHLSDEDVVPFARKLIEYSRWAIVSVPYMWEKGACKWHCQDPIDRQKLNGWIGAEPVKDVIIQDGQKRLVSLYRGMHGDWEPVGLTITFAKRAEKIPVNMSTRQRLKMPVNKIQRAPARRVYSPSPTLC